MGWHIGEPLPVHPEFGWISQIGGVTEREMHRTFNMGMGLAIAISKDSADSVSNWISERLPGTRVVGEVVDNGLKVTHQNDQVVFDHY